ARDRVLGPLPTSLAASKTVVFRGAGPAMLTPIPAYVRCLATSSRRDRLDMPSERYDPGTAHTCPSVHMPIPATRSRRGHAVPRARFGSGRVLATERSQRAGGCASPRSSDCDRRPRAGFPRPFVDRGWHYADSVRPVGHLPDATAA